MAEKDGTQGGAVAKIDFSALELELDKELDSLFAPITQPPASPTTLEPDRPASQTGPDCAGGESALCEETPQSDSVAVKKDNAFDSLLAPAMHEPVAVQDYPSAGELQNDAGGQLDFSAFSAEVDKEIDSIFAPQVTPQADTTAQLKPDLDLPSLTLDPADILLVDEPKQGAGSFSDRGSESDSISVLPQESSTEPLELESVEEPDAPPPLLDPGSLEQDSTISFDIDEITSQIDKEIDSMFVPAAAEPPSAAPEPPAAHLAESPQDVPAPVKEQVDDSPGASFDFGAIEKEIDSLFVPAKMEAEPSQPAEVFKPTPVEEILPSAGASAPEPVVESVLPLDEEQSQPRQESDFRIYPLEDDLPRLIEVFNVAYLSLDWEVSEDNLLKLQSALKDLEPYAVRSSDAVPIFKIMNAVLQRFILKPQSANSRLIELIRESQGLLAHVLLMKGETGQQEKERLNNLIERFQEMRKRALAIKREAKSRKLSELSAERGDATVPVESGAFPELPEAEPAAIELIQDVETPLHPSSEGIFSEPAAPPPIPEAGPPVEPAIPEEVDAAVQERRTPHAPQTWMEKSCESLLESLSVIDTQMQRLRQIEAVLTRNAVLAPLAEKVTKIRIALEDQALSLRNQEQLWRERTQLLYQADAAAAVSGCDALSLEVSSAEIPEKLWSEPAGSSRQSRQLDIYTIAFAEKPFAIPAENIVKVEPAARKKILGILKHGYASLADFKPLFRSIKAGVLGHWASLPTKELKSCKFEPVDFQAVEPADIVDDRYVAVFASNGERHGIIFAQATGFIEGATIHSDNAGQTFETEDGRYPFFDLDHLFSRAGLDPNGASASGRG